MMHAPLSQEISAWTREMSAPDRRRSVSLRRPIVNSGLSMLTIRRPSESVITSRGSGAAASAMGVTDYNRTLTTGPIGTYAPCRSSTGELDEAREKRPAAGHTRSADPAHAGVQRYARVGHRSTTATDFAGRAAGQSGVAVSGALSARAA